MTTEKRRGLSARLGRIFLIQLLVIGLTTLIGVYLTQLIVEDLLTRQALNREAAHYWGLYAQNPAQPLANTANMMGYITDAVVFGDQSGESDFDSESVSSGHFSEAALAAAVASGVPPELATLPVGFQDTRIGSQRVLAHVSDKYGKRLYLAFPGEQVSSLAFYFGTVPLSMVLLLMYGMLFMAHRWSQQALSPIVALAKRLKDVNFARSGRIDLNLDSLEDTANDEVAAMIEAVDQFTGRLDAAIERERVFTRDAGHELRTPLAVFKGSLDLLEQRNERPEFERAALKRMRRTIQDMEALLETLLLLAREEEVAPPADPVRVNGLIAGQIEALSPYVEGSGNQLRLIENAELDVRVPAKIIEIALSNLLRNALTYTRDGTITITVESNVVQVEDSGMGMTARELASAFEPFYRAESSRESTKGHGLGLSIVRRLARQFDWQINAQSEPGEGTLIEIVFPSA